MEREHTLRAQDAWSELIDVLQERLEHLTESGERQSVFLKMSDVYATHLHDHDSAYAVAQAAFREDYSNDAMAQQLARLAEHGHRWEHLLAEFTRVVVGLERKSPIDAANLWVRLAQWYGDHLRHLDYAIHSCEQALRVRPDHRAARAELDRFVQQRG